MGLQNPYSLVRIRVLPPMSLFIVSGGESMLKAMMEFRDMVLRNDHPINLESKELIKHIFSHESFLLTIKLLCKLLYVNLIYTARK